MNKTPINWTEVTWNPTSGCTPVSSGCRYCYARRLAEQRRGTRAFPVGFDLQLRPHKLAEPARLKRPSMIFVNSMSDLFHERIPDGYRDQIMEAMKGAPQHCYQVLTKRPAEAARYFGSRRVPDCMWLGVTLEHIDYVGRLDVLREIAAPLRFVSAEPLLSPLELDLDGIGWIIVGGESGPHLTDPAVATGRSLASRHSTPPTWRPRPDRIDWVRSIREQCWKAGVPFWFKQWGGSRPESAGRTLDGEIYDGRPSRPEADGFRLIG